MDTISIKETWANYEKVNRIRLDGVSFHDIAVQYDDSEEHVYDFWSRFNTFKKEKKRQWDKEHKGVGCLSPEKRKEYRASHRDETNARARQDRKDNPEKYKRYNQTRKKKAEERGVLLNDPEYRRNYYVKNRERLIAYSKAFYEEHREELAEYFKQRYKEHRDEILEYHVRYNIILRDRKIKERIESGELPSDYVFTNLCSRYAFQVKKYLEGKKIPFVVEKRFKECSDLKKLPFDFFIESQNTVIEVDGEHHFFPVAYGGKNHMDEAISHFERTLRHDKIKDQFCEENGIRIIRIPYFEFFNGTWEQRLDCLACQ